MDSFFRNYNSDSATGLYNSLAPLYDFIYSIHYNYNLQENLVQEYVSSDAQSIIEGACGTGRLTNRLDSSFEKVVGFDINKGVLEIAKDRNPSIDFRTADMTELEIEETFDVYCVLGNSAVHLVNGMFESFIAQSTTIVNDNGYLIFDYMPKDSMVDGYSGTNTFETERYKVKRDTVTTKKDLNHYYMSFSFKVSKLETGNSFRCGDTIISRVFDKSEIGRLLRKYGFSTVQHLNYSDKDNAAIEDGVTIAKY